MKRALEEKILLYRVQMNKDADAYAALYDLHVEPLYRFVYFKISHKEEAEDATADIFLKGWQYLTSTAGKDIRSFQRLIYVIARNKVVDIYRGRARRKECAINVADDLPTEVEDIEIVPSNILGTIRKLKQEYQEVLLFRYVEDFSVTEIAAMMGKSTTSVRVTLHRALKKLKELLDSKALL